MTTLTFGLSRALAATWGPGDEIVVSRLDHDANVWPWVRAARDAGATVRRVPFDREDCTLDKEAFKDALCDRTRLVAFGAASNAVGTINPVGELTQLAHEVGALVYVDAVHFAPHQLMHADTWGCDFLVCSAYKFFGPHVGVLYGRRDLLESLPAYQVRPAEGAIPGRWSTGTCNHEGIAGTLAAVQYLQSLGQGTTPRARLESAYSRIAHYEASLARRFLDGLASLEEIRVLGINDPTRMDERVPTFGLLHARMTAKEMAVRLGEEGIFTWSGHFYAVEVTAHLGLEPHGMLRVGLLHYNTADEVDRLLGQLRSF